MAIIYENSTKGITIEDCEKLFKIGTSVIFDEGKHVTMMTPDLEGEK